MLLVHRAFEWSTGYLRFYPYIKLISEFKKNAENSEISYNLPKITTFTRQKDIYA